MHPTIHDIARVLGTSVAAENDLPVTQLVWDSRKLVTPASSIFFALKGPRRDGHQFIGELYQKGVRFFVVADLPAEGLYPGALFLQVEDPLDALQKLAAHHRSRFSIPVIGITGSNGKTIVKEWLYQLLQDDYNIIRNPKSYNSQIGVPLSVWGMNAFHTLGIFEAGISRPAEMERLEKIIQPRIGVLTNIGEAHSEGFRGIREKLLEKLKLFSHTEVVIFNGDDALIRNTIREQGLTGFSWGRSQDCSLKVASTTLHGQSTRISFTPAHEPGSDRGETFEVDLPFTDEASLQNAMSCIALMVYLGIPHRAIVERARYLQPVNMRLELKKGINHCVVINDSYSADLSSLEIALNFLDQQAGGSPRTVILSDILQSAVPDAQLYAQVMASLEKHGVTRLIGIGQHITGALEAEWKSTARHTRIELFASTHDFLQQFRASSFRDEIILVKGARVFGFEKIVQLLEQKMHQTVLEINLNAIAHNLKVYQRMLDPSTRVMAMVKAFGYGSGGAEIAGILQYHHIDYLGVAYADEGVELRQAGISVPIMVMNPDENSFDAITEHNLEPEMYSFGMLKAFDSYLKKNGLQQYPVHIEIETGMNRLGFTPGEMAPLGDYLNTTPSFRVQSVFSHFAASEDPAQDAFSMAQAGLFEGAAGQLQQLLGYTFLRHMANSAAILRHPSLQMDMVRLGIGLYGVDSSGSGLADLQTVAVLRTTVAQLKRIRKGESVGYNRMSIVDRDSIIATVRLGYADGYPRRLGNGVGKMYVGGQLAPVIGTVCMDMTMLDVTGIPQVKEGDEVIVFGPQLPVQELAKWAQTIPYEIMTGISQRVKRVYFEE